LRRGAAQVNRVVIEQLKHALTDVADDRGLQNSGPKRIQPQHLERLIAAGTQLRPFPQPVMEACLKASNEVNAETAATNADYKKVLDSMQAFRNDEVLWWQVAEYTYDGFMIRTRTRA